MRFATALLTLVWLVLSTVVAVSPVYADTVVWNDNAPKRPEFTLYCHAQATVDGNTFVWNSYISGDLDQPRDSEIKFMQGHCDMVGRRSVAGYFLYQKDTVIDPNIVEVSWKGP